MSSNKRLPVKVLNKLKAPYGLCEQLQPGSEEAEAYTLFKTLDGKAKEEQLKERSIGPPALCSSTDFSLHGMQELQEMDEVNGPPVKVEEFDPDKDQRNFGICLRMLLFCCFCSC